MKITFWLDFVCPHSYIGKARLEDAIQRAGIDRNDVEIEYKTLEYDKNAPKEYVDDAVKIVCKRYYYGPTGAKMAMKRISDWGKFEGLELNYLTARYTNSLDANRLLKLAQSKGDSNVTEKLVDGFFKAFFTDNLELSDRNVLIDVAEKAGLNKADIEKVLDSNEFEAEVRADEAEAESNEIGTPYTIINGEKGEFIVNGAQDGVMFVKALKDAAGIN